MLKVLSIFAAIAITTQPASADLFSISVPTFSADKPEKPDYLARRVAKSDKIKKSQLQSGHVWVSFAILGGPKAFEHLIKENKLYVGVETSCGGWTAEEKISIGINQQVWLDNQEALENSFRRNGYFKWRTRARTSQINCNQLTIRVYDIHGNVISPPAHTESYERTLEISQEAREHNG